jgi:methionyl-tRNA formyltransferase
MAGQIVPTKQPATGSSYARKITKEDGHLDWTLPAVTLWNRIRGLRPWPGTFTHLKRGESSKLLKIWQAEVLQDTSPNPGQIIRADKHELVIACGKQSLRILELQSEGGKRLTTQQFLAGHPMNPGELLG